MQAMLLTMGEQQSPAAHVYVRYFISVCKLMPPPKKMCKCVNLVGIKWKMSKSPDKTGVKAQSVFI